MTGEELRALRHETGLSQMAFAEAMGVRKNTVARWERGERPISKMVELAARQVATARRD